jgi:hypothetical protein
MVFEDIKVHVRFKLFALWSSVMFFYIYGDYFELYQPGQLQQMLAGRLPFAGNSQGVLVAMASVMAIPSLMPFLSLVLPRGVNRRVNIAFGTICSLIMLLLVILLLVTRSVWYYYVAYATIEIILTITIVCYAWAWPKQPAR